MIRILILGPFAGKRFGKAFRSLRSFRRKKQQKRFPQAGVWKKMGRQGLFFILRVTVTHLATGKPLNLTVMCCNPLTLVSYLLRYTPRVGARVLQYIPRRYRLGILRTFHSLEASEQQLLQRIYKWSPRLEALFLGTGGGAQYAIVASNNADQTALGWIQSTVVEAVGYLLFPPKGEEDPTLLVRALARLKEVEVTIETKSDQEFIRVVGGLIVVSRLMTLAGA